MNYTLRRGSADAAAEVYQSNRSGLVRLLDAARVPDRRGDWFVLVRLSKSDAFVLHGSAGWAGLKLADSAANFSNYFLPEAGRQHAYGFTARTHIS